MTTTLTGQDFIVFGLQPWDFEMGSNSKNIAMELAKHNRVLYVNRPIERSTLYTHRKDQKIQNRLRSLRKGIDVLTNPMENLWVFNPRAILESINWLPHGMLYDRINYANAGRLGKQIRWAMQELNFNRPVLFIDNDFLKGFYLREHLPGTTLVYYIRDYLLSQPYFTKHGMKMEPEFIAKADLVVTNSRYLCNYARKYNKRSYDIGQGCELEGYIQENYPVPMDLQGIPGPIIGYCGALLSTRLDLDLLRQIAESRPTWNLVLVGPQDRDFQQSVLHRLPNVHFLGSKPVEALPAYVHQFDICINPQVLNQMTIGNYPRKIDEYLAAGKPVVATETEAMQLFREYCSLATDAGSYIQQIETLLSQPEDVHMIAARREFALGHTWEASVEGLYTALNTFRKPVYETRA